MAATVFYPLIIISSIAGWVAGKRTHILPRVNRNVAVPLIVFTLPLLPIIFLHPEKYEIFGRIYEVVLIIIYIFYTRYMLKKEKIEAPLYKLLLKNPILQPFISVICLAFGAELLVNGIVELRSMLSVDKTALTVIIVPIATVVPESVVGLIFLFKERDSEGVSAVIGEKALYDTIFPGIALTAGIYSLEISALLAIILSIIVSIIEIAFIMKFRYFGLSAPVGFLAYLFYLYNFYWI